jgi:hypothetical protein
MRRTWVAAVVLVAVLGVVAAGCGGDDGGSVSSGGSKQSTTSNTSAQSYVGLSKQEAIAKAKTTDSPWRITREDKETFLVTQDFVENRINFEIDNGKVTKATYG